jgi:protein gp37
VIEWTGKSWNPWVGCEAVSAGCAHCYAARMATRLQSVHPHYAGVAARGRWTGRLALAPERTMLAPLAWAPTRIFPCSMSDFYHPAADPWRPAAYRVIEARTDHTWQVLTKRPERIGPDLPAHVWAGTSVEDERALGRVAQLREHAAHVTVRWLSVEPLLGPLPGLAAALDAPGAPIDWVVVGGESGPRCRPCEAAWLREIRDVCQERGVALFLKQIGGHPNKAEGALAVLDGRRWTQYPEDER